MKFIFLIGVEGSGHGLMRSILEPFLMLPKVIDQGGWHAPLIALWDSHNNYSNHLQCLSIAKQNIQECAKTYLYAFESASFPFGQPRDSLRRPQIYNIENIIRELGYDFVPIVIYRNFYDTVHSGVRRGFTTNTVLQAKIIESNMHFIHNQLQYMNNYFSIRFESIISNPTSYVEPISKILQVGSSIIRLGIKNIRNTSSASTNFISSVNEVVQPRSLEYIYDAFYKKDIQKLK